LRPGFRPGADWGELTALPRLPIAALGEGRRGSDGREGEDRKREGQRRAGERRGGKRRRR